MQRIPQPMTLASRSAGPRTPHLTTRHPRASVRIVTETTTMKEDTNRQTAPGISPQFIFDQQHPAAKHNLLRKREQNTVDAGDGLGGATSLSCVLERR